MVEFFKQIILYPVLIIQLVLLGPGLMAASNDKGSQRVEVESSQEERVSSFQKHWPWSARNRQRRAFEKFQRQNAPADMGPIENFQWNWKERTKEAAYNAKASSAEALNQAKAQAMKKKWIAASVNRYELMKNDVLNYIDTQTNYREGKTVATETFSNGVAYVSNTPVGEWAAKNYKHIKNTKRIKRNYYVKQGRFYRESTKEAVNLQLNHPVMKLLAHSSFQTEVVKEFNSKLDSFIRSLDFDSLAKLDPSSKEYQKMKMDFETNTTEEIRDREYKKMNNSYQAAVNSAFDARIKAWAQSGQTSQIPGTKALKEQFNKMYVESARQVWMEAFSNRIHNSGNPASEQKKVAKEFNKTVLPILKNQLKSMDRVLTGSAVKTLKNIRRAVLDAVSGVTTFRTGKYVVTNTVNQRLRALNTGLVWRSLKAWPVETFIFNMAIDLSSMAQDAVWDESFNPLYVKENLDARHHGEIKLSYNGYAVPYLESLDYGFLGFIAANRAFQKIAPYSPVPIPMFLRGQLGMAAGSIVSTIIGEWRMSPAFKAEKYAKQMRNQVIATINQLPDNASDEYVKALNDQVRTWETVARNANHVWTYDLSSSKFWKKQIDHVANLLGASIFSSMVFGKLILNPLQKAHQNRAQKVQMNGKGVSFTQKGKNLGKLSYKPIQAMVGFTRDATRTFINVVGSAPMMKLWHFAAFLIADAQVRPFFTPMIKQMRAEDAYDAYRYVKNTLPERRDLLSNLARFDRLNMSIYDQMDKTVDQYTSQGRFEEMIEMFSYIKEYYDTKNGYRMKMVEPIQLKHDNWKTYLTKFTSEFESTKTMYESLEDLLLIAQSDQRLSNVDQNHLVQPEIHNTFNYTTYVNLHESTKALFEEAMASVAGSTENKKYAFGFFDYIQWQTNMFEDDLEASENVKSFELSLDQDEDLKLFFRNGMAERMLWQMAFGGDAETEELFEPNHGKMPKLNMPRIIEELPYSPTDMNYLKLDEDHAIEMVGGFLSPLTSDRASIHGPVVKRYKYYPLMTVKFYDPKDDTYKNILQLINDRALPTFRLGQKDEDYQFTVGDYLNKHLFCRPEGKTDGQIHKGQWTSEDCKNGAIAQAFDHYNSVYSEFVRKDLSRLLVNTGNIGNSNLAGFYRLLTLGIEHGFMKKTDSDYRNLAKGIFDKLEVGSQNLYLSMVEDVIAAGGFIQKALPKASDFDPVKQKDYHLRAKALEAKGYDQFILKTTLKLSSNLLDMALETQNSKAFDLNRTYQKSLDELEEKYNKAMCEFYNRPKTIDKNNIKSSGVVNVNGTRYYRYYNTQKKLYVFTKIDPLQWCDVDQIQHKIDVAAVNPEDMAEMEDHSAEKDSFVGYAMDHWNQSFQEQGLPPLAPDEASPQALRDYFRLENNSHDNKILSGKIMELIFIENDQVLTKDDVNTTNRVQEFLRQNLELRHDEEKETAGELALENNNYTDALAAEINENRKTIAEAQKIPFDQIYVTNRKQVRPVVSLRTAIASKSIDMFKKLMNEEMGTYKDYMATLANYAPNSYDQIAPALCEVRLDTAHNLSMIQTAMIANSQNLSIEEVESRRNALYSQLEVITEELEYSENPERIKALMTQAKAIEANIKKFEPEMVTMSETSACEVAYKDLLQNKDRSSEAWTERFNYNLELEEEYYREHEKPVGEDESFRLLKQLKRDFQNWSPKRSWDKLWESSMD